MNKPTPDPLREKLLRRLTAAGMLSILIAYPALMIRMVPIGFHPLHAVQTLLVGLLLLLFLFRRRVDPRLNAIGFLLALFAFVLLGLRIYGPLSGSFIVIPFIAVFASVVFDRRIALWLLGLSTAGVVLVGVLYQTGAWRYQIDVLAFAQSWTSWATPLVIEVALASWYLFLIAPLNEAHSQLSQRLETVLQGMNDALFILDQDTGAILQVNGKMGEMFGCSPEEASRLSVADFSEGLPPYDQAHAQAWMAKAAHEGPQLFAWRAKDRAGRRFWVEVNMRPVRLDGAVRLLAMVRDISERAKTEALLRESEERFRTLVDYAPEAIVVLDVDKQLHFVDANENACRLFGYSREELLQRGVFAVSPPAQPGNQDSAAAAKALLDKALDGHTQTFEWIHQNAQGQTFPCEVRLVRLPAGNRRLVRGSVIDISERKRLQAQTAELTARLDQAQRMEAIGTLAGGIAHDFNNILGAMIGYTDLALMALPAEHPVRAMLENVERGGARAVDLVRQILTFSRQAKQDRHALAPAPIVKEALKLLRASLPSTITIQSHCESSATVLADAGQVHQIVMNLCTNAGLAMKERGGTLEIGLHDLEVDATLSARHPGLKPGRHVRLTVKDTGNGIAPEVLPRIFEPFFTTRPQGEGTGLGLSVVHGIVKSWEGAIDVESEVGRGTRFAIYLPVCETAPPPRSAEHANHQGHEHVLFIDDEIDLTEVARQGLTHFGYTVTAFNDPARALEAFRRAPGDFDIVITDMTMPGITGEILAAEVRRLRPALPVVLVSGFSDRMTTEQALAAGFDGFVDKPLRPTTLAQLIRKLLDRPR
jgi:PAS domain S-box-containing protein